MTGVSGWKALCREHRRWQLFGLENPRSLIFGNAERKSHKQCMIPSEYGREMCNDQKPPSELSSSSRIVLGIEPFLPLPRSCSVQLQSSSLPSSARSFRGSSVEPRARFRIGSCLSFFSCFSARYAASVLPRGSSDFLSRLSIEIMRPDA